MRLILKKQTPFYCLFFRRLLPSREAPLSPHHAEELVLQLQFRTISTYCDGIHLTLMLDKQDVRNEDSHLVKSR